MKIGIIVNRTKPGAAVLAREVDQVFSGRKGLGLLWEGATARLIRKKGLPLEDVVAKADLILVAGGDGSLLQVAREVYPRSVPILGLNIGSLGFLTSLTRHDLVRAVEAITKKQLRLSPRLVLHTEVYRGNVRTSFPCALNDVVVSRGDVSRLVRMRVKVAGELVTEYVGDGLIIATPTGSTAYSIAAGGPLVSPDAQAISLTPICPHTLTNRSLVVAAGPEITVEIPLQPHPMGVQIDGQPAGRLRSGDRIVLKPASKPVVLAYLPEANFFHILRQKLKWSGASV